MSENTHFGHFFIKRVHSQSYDPPPPPPGGGGGGGPLHKTMVTLQLMIHVSLQSMVTIIDFLTLIGYGAVLLW